MKISLILVSVLVLFTASVCARETSPPPPWCIAAREHDGGVRSFYSTPLDPPLYMGRCADEMFYANCDKADCYSVDFALKCASDGAATSAATAAVTGSSLTPANTSLPTISGTAKVGQTLTAANGSWTNSPTQYTYQWNSSGATFSVSGGKILDPTGAVWHGQGAGVLDQEIQGVIGTASGGALANRMLSMLPGLNLVRIANYTQQGPSAYASFISVMTAAHVVCVFENHDATQTVYTGAQLTAESNWYASLASYYLGNPYVWFQSMNEPGYTGDYLQMTATYNAIRGTGNNTIVLFEAAGGAAGDPSNLDSTTFTNSMHNIGWDLHCYNFESGYSTNLTTITNDQNARIAAMQTVTSADGVMPVICLETGNSTTGASLDAGGTQELQATFANPNLVGVAAWIFDSLYTGNAAEDNMTNSGGTVLNAMGTQVAGYIASGASTFPATGYGPIHGATASTYVPVTSDVGNTLTISVVASNLSGSGGPATSVPTGSVVP